MNFEWNEEKNSVLRQQRGICFEDIVVAIQEGKLISVEQPLNVKYRHQLFFIVNINDYVYVVPFVKRENDILILKTIFPDRKRTKKYLP
ncbi:toxin [Candidatus Roizmanbacteria bacterium]|nr:toxin [Candidatus Roizmanbacteria bacterium]